MSKRTRPESTIYPKHFKAWDLEPYYSRHIGAMTSEQLHDKADIAEQLAWRDQRIAELEEALHESERRSGTELRTITDDLLAIQARLTGAQEALERPCGCPAEYPCDCPSTVLPKRSWRK